MTTNALGAYRVHIPATALVPFGAVRFNRDVMFDRTSPAAAVILPEARR